MMSVKVCPKVLESARKCHFRVIIEKGRTDAHKVQALSDLVQMLIAYIEENEEASR